MRGRSIDTSNKQLLGPYRGTKEPISFVDHDRLNLRHVRTASQPSRIRLSKHVMLANKQIIPQNIRNAAILHQKTQSEGQSSVIMLPKNIEEARNPKAKRELSPNEQRSQKDLMQEQLLAEKSGRWVNFSRKNLQQITSRLKSIRNLKYSTHQAHNLEQKLTNLKFSEASLACKSLQPNRAPSPCNWQRESVKQLRAKNLSKHHISPKKQPQPRYQIQFGGQQVRERSNSALGKEFHTKLKKKCLESNPHVLASVIKRKNQNADKAQLYDFVQKIIKKSQKQ